MTERPCRKARCEANVQALSAARQKISELMTELAGVQVDRRVRDAEAEVSSLKYQLAYEKGCATKAKNARNFADRQAAAALQTILELEEALASSKAETAAALKQVAEALKQADRQAKTDGAALRYPQHWSQRPLFLGLDSL